MPTFLQIKQLKRIKFCEKKFKVAAKNKIFIAFLALVILHRTKSIF